MARISSERKETIIRQIKEGSSFTAPYVVMNLLAAVLAYYGLLADNAAVIIGAMIIAAVMNPLVGVALGLVESDHRLLHRGLFTLFIGLAGMFGVTLLLGFFSRDLAVTQSITLVTQPGLFDLMIALAGGAAAAYATVSPHLLGALVGVAVATTLVPPLAASGILLARGESDLAAGALLLVLTHIVAIQFAMSVVFWVMGFRKVTRREGATWRVFARRNMVTMSLLIVLGAVLTINFQSALSKENYETDTKTILAAEVAKLDGDQLAEVVFEPTKDEIIVRAEVRGPRNQIAPEQVAAIESKLPTSPDNKPVTLRIRYIHVIVTDKYGQNYTEVLPNTLLYKP